MGIKASKKEIIQMLEKNSTFYELYNHHIKIEYKLLDKEKNLSSEKNEIDEPKNNENNSFSLSDEEIQLINDPKLNIINIKVFPYCAIGTINVQFPVSDEIFEYTCFLISANAVVTLASNLENKSKGGKAKSIITSFNKEKVDWNKIYIQGKEFSKVENDEEKENIFIKVDLDNLSSKLAVILYDSKISDEQLGVEEGKKEDFEFRENYVVFSFKEKNFKSNTFSEEENLSQSKFREIFISQMNPFLEESKKGDTENIELIKQSPGSPLYYRDCNTGVYVIAIVNEFLEFQYFDRKTMIFLTNMVHKGKLILKNKNFDDEGIFQLTLQNHNLGPSEINYITEFNLKNLKILNLSNNLIKSQGVLYLCKGGLCSLEILNLNCNEIGDDELKYISEIYCFFKLNSLYLFDNNISSKGIKHLIKAKFINNLILLTLSENRKIGDTGIRYIKEHKGWDHLIKLNLDFTGLSDIQMDYINKFFMPQLKKLNLQGNKFSSNIKMIINDLRRNQIHVNCKIITEKKKIRKK